MERNPTVLFRVLPRQQSLIKARQRKTDSIWHGDCGPRLFLGQTVCFLIDFQFSTGHTEKWKYLLVIKCNYMFIWPNCQNIIIKCKTFWHPFSVLIGLWHRYVETHCRDSSRCHRLMAVDINSAFGRLCSSWETVGMCIDCFICLTFASFTEGQIVT